MIASGTGITPMLQIIRAALKNPADNTRLSLIYANVNVEDILLKKELDDLVAAHPHCFSVYYVLNNTPQGWAGSVGFVTKEQIDKCLPHTADNMSHGCSTLEERLAEIQLIVSPIMSNLYYAGGFGSPEDEDEPYYGHDEL